MCKQRSISHKFVFLSKCFFDFSYYLPHLFISPFLFLSFCRFGLLLSSRSIDITTPERSTTIFRAEEFHCYRDPKKLSSLRYYSAAEVHNHGDNGNVVISKESYFMSSKALENSVNKNNNNIVEKRSSSSSSSSLLKSN